MPWVIGSGSALSISRLTIGPPVMFSEQIGDPVTTLGGAVVPNTRTAPQFQATIGTWAADGNPDTPAARLILRRQLRSMLNNSPLKLQAFLYLQYWDDPENNGWFVPDQGMLEDMFAPSGLATGLWQLATQNWYLVGHRRTHREARQAWLKDLRTGLYPRDQLGWIYSTDFSALPAVAASVLPSGAFSPQDNVTGQVPATTTLPTGRDGAKNLQTIGLSDLQVVSFERPEASIGQGDVIVYDRMGQITAPSTGPDTNWVEAYGPDWQWNWLTAGQANDCPVLDNGLVRVRYDASTGDPGLRVDVWNGTNYVEQGKLTVYRTGDVDGYCNTFVSSDLMEWTPERAVAAVTVANSADSASRERVFITMQRGEMGARFECYPAPKIAGTAADSTLTWTPNGPDSNDSLFFEPSTSSPASGIDLLWSTSASTWTSAAGTFSSTTGNFLSILRCIGGASTVGSYQTNLVVLQQGLGFAGVNDSSAYGGTQVAVKIVGSGGLGYVQARVSFVSTQSDQVMGSTTSWTSSQASHYRVFGYGGATPVWTDYGEYTGTSVSTGSSSRVEAHQTQDRTRTGAIYGGCRDRGQIALFDSRMLGAVTAR